MFPYSEYKDRVKELRGVGKLYDLPNDYFILNNPVYFQDLMTFEDFKKCKNFDSNRSKKRYRCANNYSIIEKIALLTRSKMVFGTITLNDDFMKLSYNTQKQIIQRYLKKHFFYVIKNADYGDKTERLHYHFIGLTFEEFISSGKKSKKGRLMYNLKNDSFKWGFAPNYEIIPFDMKDKKKLSNYLVKLNNHSNKISTKRSRLSILKNKKYLSKYCVFADTIL